MEYSVIKTKVSEKIPNDKRRSYSVFSLTINPNITNMTTKQLETFEGAVDYFFKQDIFEKYLSATPLKMSVKYQMEKGAIKKSDHVQCVINMETTYGQKILLNLDDMRNFFNGVVEKYFPEVAKRNVMISVKWALDYSKMLIQYTAKI